MLIFSHSLKLRDLLPSAASLAAWTAKMSGFESHMWQNAYYRGFQTTARGPKTAHEAISIGHKDILSVVKKLYLRNMCLSVRM